MTSNTATEAQIATAIAKAEITELRNLYARATDAIGRNTPEGIAEGRAIYHRIFTADATIGAAGIDPVTGPDAWVDVVEGALEEYNGTQHLIGSHVVEVKSLPDADGNHGQASMSSYLQAWHSTAQNKLYMFIGTYHDSCVRSADNGWQIAEMHLENTADEVRTITPREGGLSTVGKKSG